MLKKVLIPLDGSKLGETALNYVEEMIVALSVEQKVEITLIQVMTLETHKVYGDEDPSPLTPLTEEEIEPIKKEAFDYLNQAGESLRSKGATVNSEVIIGVIGATSAEEIIKAENDINPDLVVMSTHGLRGPSRWVFGSVTEKVLRAGKAPILVVRAEKKT